MEPLQIALCDDEQAQRELWEKYIREWAAGRKYQIRLFSFPDGEALLEDFSRKGFDLVLLDIQMQGMDGMYAARKIRAAGLETGILFVTGYEDYLAEGYEVEAFRYLLKPLQREKLWEALDQFLLRRRGTRRYWTVETPEGQKRVALAEILYLESFGHTCLLYTREESFLVKKGISEVEKELEILGLCVFRTHRSYLVNLSQVTGVGRKVASLAGGREVPVSRTQYQALNRAFIRLFRRES